jgi:aspartyl/glutamyl-tRNA(Asn/Gln) amidotransferase C subunit
MNAAMNAEHSQHMIILAGLARLLPDDAHHHYARDIEAMLTYFNELSDLDKYPDPEYVCQEPLQPFRDDKITDSLALQQVLANAPHVMGDGFCVPKVVE